MSVPKLGAPDHHLDNLCVILDYNGIQLDNFVKKILDLEPIIDKVKSFGWPVLDINGHDLAQIDKALDQAEATKGSPTYIVAHTVKGKGVSFMENDPEWHGKAPKPNEAIEAIGEDGYTQMGLEDMACLRSLPNIPIIQPADEIETKQVVAYAVEHRNPLYLRLTRQNLEPVHDDKYQFRFGKADVLRAGTDVSILATGGTVWNSLEAAKKLATDGVNAEVVNVATVKPLDEEALLLSAGKTGRVVTVEDHSIHGGLGGAVSELLSEVMPTPVKRLGVVGFGESGDAKGLYAKHGLDPDGIAKSVLKFLNR